MKRFRLRPLLLLLTLAAVSLGAFRVWRDIEWRNEQLRITKRRVIGGRSDRAEILERQRRYPSDDNKKRLIRLEEQLAVEEARLRELEK
jgi:hypothetical protein